MAVYHAEMDKLLTLLKGTQQNPTIDYIVDSVLDKAKDDTTDPSMREALAQVVPYAREKALHSAIYSAWKCARDASFIIKPTIQSDDDEENNKT